MESEINKIHEKEKHRESPSGFHYYMLYEDCKRKWHLKYVHGLRPEKKSSPLVFGSAWHEGKARYWQGKDGKSPYDSEGFVKVFKDTLNEMQDEYLDPAAFQEDMNKGLRLIDDWLITWDEVNKQTLKPVMVEEELKIPIGPNGEFIFTVRPDVVLWDKERRKYLVEDSKSTGWSLNMVFATQELGDQMTSYIWALDKVHPEWKIETARIDGSYARQSKVASQRSLEIYRSKQDLMLFEMNLYGIIMEVSQKYKSLQKYPWPLLFPRNGGQCYKYNRPCEYSEICRRNLKLGEIPIGFTHDPWVELDEKMKIAQGISMDKFLLEEKND